MRITITFNPPLEDRITSWRRLAETGIYEGLGRLAQEAGQVMLFALQDEAPKRTGQYASEIRQVQHGGQGRIVLEYKAPARLSLFIIGGTRAHDIYPVRAKALAFYAADGNLVFAKHVSHPGTAPNPYPARAWDAARDEVLDILSRTGRELLESVQ